MSDLFPFLAAEAWLGGSRWVGGLGSPGEILGRLGTMVAMPAGISVLIGGTVKVPLPPTILLMPG
jgi:hypothetical protein